MSLLEIIRTRRSIRKYTAQKIARGDLDVILEAGLLAPSACNSQPWRFVAFDDDDAKRAFADAVFTGIYAPAKFAAEAPVLVALVSNRGNVPVWLGNAIKGAQFWVMDAGIAGQNMVLQAWSMGIGSCWIGWFDHKKAAKHLNAGFGEKVEILFAFGYPAEAPEARPRKDKAEMFYYNKYK